MAFSQPLAGQFHHQIKKELTPLIQLVAPKLSDSKQAHIDNPIAELFFPLCTICLLYFKIWMTSTKTIIPIIRGIFAT